MGVRSDNLITFQDRADAIYDPRSDELRFFKLDIIKRIFFGIEYLYKEATQKQLKSFMNCASLSFVNDFSIDQIGIQNRKRIALIYLKWMQSDSHTIKQYLTYARKYDISISDQQFVIGSDKDMKNLLYIIGERYYEAEIEGEKRIANSIIAIPNST